ncbi:restriction endonuclease subunit S [Helicobacter cetorum]|uniref:Restriction modification system DNA specificity subunit n=1 Tax=Helicobacter cetorum (strain ATCC BAA-429 / MIT 00-7128) TaxID=182217 RepID=I0EML1_HELC0|nr:restriction endonuclease subunit S [Helicobacter cetorum]AFI04180.1 restriction modification system DNA specificity subunit [Helicobacter cetorum MIT 00-7128]
MTLNEIATIKTGLILGRKKSLDISTTPYHVISLKSFNQNGYYNQSLTDTFTATCEIPKEFFLKQNDILMSIREPHTAVYIRETPRYETIISSIAVVIRLEKKYTDLFNPLFLCLYLNSPFTNKALFSQGSTIAMLNISNLGQIKINLPPKKVQDRIATLQTLIYQENTLLLQLLTEKENLMQGLLLETLNKEQQ